MSAKRILSIAGTAPEAIKFAPIVPLLDRHHGIEHRLIATGQHGALFHAALADFGLAADGDLALPNADPDDFADRVAGAMPRPGRGVRAPI